MVILFPEIANIVGVSIVYFVSKNTIWYQSTIYGVTYALWLYYIFTNTIIDLKLHERRYSVMSLFVLFNVAYFVYLAVTYINILIVTNTANRISDLVAIRTTISHFILITALLRPVYFLYYEDYKIFGTTYLVYKCLCMCNLMLYSVLCLQQAHSMHLNLNFYISVFIILNVTSFFLKAIVHTKREYWKHRKNLNAIFNLIFSQRKQSSNLNLTKSIPEAICVLNSAPVRVVALKKIKKDLIKILIKNESKNAEQITNTYIAKLSKTSMKRTHDYKYIPKSILNIIRDLKYTLFSNISTLSPV